MEAIRTLHTMAICLHAPQFLDYLDRVLSLILSPDGCSSSPYRDFGGPGRFPEKTSVSLGISDVHALSNNTIAANAGNGSLLEIYLESSTNTYDEAVCESIEQ